MADKTIGGKRDDPDFPPEAIYVKQHVN